MRVYGQFLAGPTVDHISGTQCSIFVPTITSSSRAWNCALHNSGFVNGNMRLLISIAANEWADVANDFIEEVIVALAHISGPLNSSRERLRV